MESITPENTAERSEKELAIIVIKPDAFADKDEIIKEIKRAGLHIVKTVTKKLPDNFVVSAMYSNLPDSIEDETLKHFNAGPSELILLEGGPDLLDRIAEVTGTETNPEKSEKDSIRYRYGEHFGRETPDGRKYFRNAIHRAKNKEEQKADLQKFEHYF